MERETGVRLVRVARRLSFVPLLGLLLGSPPALAEGEAVAITLRYHGASGCPDEATFFDELRVRAPSLRRAYPAETSYRVDITVATTGATSTGDVELHDVDGRVARRHLKGAGCAEVGRALALVIALDAVGTASVPPQAQPEPPAPSATPPPAPEPWPPPPAPGAGTAAPGPPGRSPPEATPRWTPLALVQGGITTGVAPGGAPSGSLVLGVDRVRSAAGGVDSAFVLGVSYASAETPGAGDTVAFRLVSAFFDACVWHPSLGPRVTLMPCARVTGGYHFADVVPGGRGIAGAGLLALGVDAWLRVRLAGPVFASAMAAGEIPLTPAHFTEEGAPLPLFETPRVSGSLNLGAGVSFP